MFAARRASFFYLSLASVRMDVFLPAFAPVVVAMKEERTKERRTGRETALLAARFPILHAAAARIRIQNHRK